MARVLIYKIFIVNIDLSHLLCYNNPDLEAAGIIMALTGIYKVILINIDIIPAAC